MTTEHPSERRLVTCMFIDVVGSTDLTMKLGPERMKRELDRAFAELRDILQAEGGTVEKYIGDAIFALFGAPVAHADDPERALRAASDCLQWAAARPAARARLDVRVGVDTGEALVDLAGVEAHQKMAVGAVVNVAARLQSQADPGTVLAGPACREATAHVAEFSGERALELKGIGPVVAASFVRLRTQAQAPQVPFVGRAKELARLRDAVSRARGGRATFALVSGPPGQGKTRLSEELLRGLSAICVLSARCRPGTEAGAATPFRQLVVADVGEAALDALGDRMTSLFEGGGRRDEILEVVSHTAGLTTSERLLAMPAANRRDLVHDAWRHYVGAIARERPLAIWVEDLHWAEPAFVGILDRITSRLEAPLFVLGTARPEFLGSAALRPSEDLVHVELGPLDPDDALKLARGASAIAVRAVERAEGNPLFIVELARARQVGPELPMTVQGAIAARIDELPAADRQLIQLASVVGETFGVRDAALLSERDPVEVAGTLARLVHGRYLSQVDGRYRFGHALVRDVAYGRVPVAERMKLHARYAREGVDPEDAEALAHHWWEALRPPDAEWVWEGASELAAMRADALEVHLVAAKRHADRLSHERALGLYDRALALADSDRDVGRVEEGIGWAYHRNALGDDAWTHRSKAIEAYRRAGVDPPAALYADMLAVPVMNFGYFLTKPDPDAVTGLLDEGERIARASGDQQTLARLVAERAVFTGDDDVAAEALRLVDASGEPHYAGEALRAIAVAQFLAGALADADATFARIDEVRRRGGFVNVAEVLMWRALQRVMIGDLEGTEVLAREFDEVAVTAPPHTRGHLLGIWGTLHLARGDWDRARETARTVETLLEQNPKLPFCLVPAAATAAAAAADRLGGRAYAADLDALLERMMTGLPSQQAGVSVIPRAMSAEDVFDADLERSYSGWPWWVRNVLDPLGFNPAIAIVVAGRWDDLPARTAALDRFAEKGSRVAGAMAAAMREELAASRGGSRPTHAELRELGYIGFSELLRFRPG